MLMATQKFVMYPWAAKTILSLPGILSFSFSDNQCWALLYICSSLMAVKSLGTEEISSFSRGSSYGSNNFLLDWGQDCCQANLSPGKAAQPGKAWSAWRCGMVHHPAESVVQPCSSMNLSRWYSNTVWYLSQFIATFFGRKCKTPRPRVPEKTPPTKTLSGFFIVLMV